MKTKQAKDLRMGDTIRVNLGCGVVEKIVDRVVHDGDRVSVTLYVSSGRRPVIDLKSTQKVEV